MNINRRVIGNLSLGIGTLLSALGHASIAAAACPNPPAVPSAAVLVLLDRSGSMAGNGKCTDNTVKRKWECGVNDAHSWIANNDPSKERAYFVWQFATQSDPNVTTVQDNGSSNQGYCEDEAFSKLTPTGPLIGPLVDDASTPLAGAYCDAVDFLLKYRASLKIADLPLYIKLESDGLENSTPITHACHGDDLGSANFVPARPVVLKPSDSPPTADGLILGSWEAQMYDAAVSGKVHVYPPLDPGAFISPNIDDSPVITNVTFIDDFIQSSAFAAQRVVRPAGADSFMQSGMFALAAAGITALSPNDELVKFFSGMASRSGARLTRFGSGVVPPAGDPTGFHVLPGDADDNGCVNSADFNLLKAAYGQKAVAGNPNAIAADLNSDGVVNSNDYLMLSAQYGKGCSQTPSPLPVLGNALFGFEDASKWSSTVPLSISASKHSEGSYSLKVGGSGWREVKSITFNSALFSGVTSKLGLDVLIPAAPSNPAWLGQVLVFVNAPSAGINNLSLGSVELTGKPLNTFSTVQFAIPANVRAAMTSARADFSVKVVVNANDANYELDNLRFQ